jgi:formamidopyrimidine-DNA glycosylase
MPELPEVETIARGVHERVRGDVIAQAWFGSYREPFKTPAARQAAGLEGRTILAVHRTGKHIVCELGDARFEAASHPSRKNAAREGHPSDISKRGSFAPHLNDEDLSQETPVALRMTATEMDRKSAHAAQWIVHLGMTGRLLVTTPDAPVVPHTHARLTLASGRELRFVDPRRFGRLEWRDLGKTAAFASPGRDPLTIEADDFAALFSRRKLAIKAALLNQTLLAGVGNIYADESLFRAGIRPKRQAGRLTRAELERLRLALREVLEHAIRLGGSSVSDYVDANGVRGFFQLEHCVYLRTGEPCRRCQSPIQRILLAGRGTHYCPQCQR